MNVRSVYWQSISNAISARSRLRLSKFETFASDSRPPTKKELTNEAFLNIRTEYRLSPDCRVLVMHAKLALYLPGKSPRPAASSVIGYYSAQVGDFERDDAVRVWAANHGADFRKAVSEGVETNAKLIQYFLDEMDGRTNAAARPARLQARTLPFREWKSRIFTRIPVRVVDENPDRFIVAAGKGSFFSLPRREFEIKYIAEK